MHEAQLIEYYSPPGTDVKAAAEQVRGRVPQIRGLAKRLAHLRQQGLLTGPNPGGKYEQWIKNTYLNGVAISTVIDIARTHDIRPDDFGVLNG
jgi:hypothetical protein